MYKRRAIHLDAMRFAKSTQVKLDEINYRIEQDKKRILMLNRFEKIKVWNELREIRRVFVPRYVPGRPKNHEDEQDDASSKDAERPSKPSSSTCSEQTYFTLNNNIPQCVHSPSKLNKRQQLRAENCDSSSAFQTRKPKSTIRERKISPASMRVDTFCSVTNATSAFDEKDSFLNQNERAKDKRKSRITSLDVSSLRKIVEEEPKRKNSGNSPPLSETKNVSQSVQPVAEANAGSMSTDSVTPRSHSSLSQRGIISPSNSMLSVACGYMAFKKLLRNKRQNDSFVSPRFRKQNEGDKAIASNSAFLRSKETPIAKPKTAKPSQRMAKNILENQRGEEETTSSESNDSQKPRRSSESSLSSISQIKDKPPRIRKLSAGWNQGIDKTLDSTKRAGASRVWIEKGKLVSSTSKLQLHEEGTWREKRKPITKTAAWTVNDGQAMKKLMS